MTRRTARQEQPVLELVDALPADISAGQVELTEDGGGQPESFDTFYYREFPRLLTLARALAGDAQAGDIAQESMVVAYQRWDTVRTFASPAGWVRGVCSHKAVSLIRRSRSENRAVARLRLHRPTQAEPGNPLADNEFWREVRRLPRRQAQAVALYYVLDLSVADVAETMECAEGTVKAHLSRAREALSKRLSPEGEERS